MKITYLGTAILVLNVHNTVINIHEISKFPILIIIS